MEINKIIMKRIKKALISVSDKKNLKLILNVLKKFKIDIICLNFKELGINNGNKRVIKQTEPI